MAKNFMKGRYKTKRQTTRMRNKIAKNVRAHNKKQRRLDKKDPNKRKRKDPGVPNTLPFKESVLKEAEERKMQKLEMEKKMKEKRKKNREKEVAKRRNLDNMVKNALKKQREFDKKKSMVNDPKRGKAVENSLKTFYKEFKKVVDAADVVLEVLDARDPLGSRCSEVEKAIISSGTNKKLVLVLNKIDLVPKENVTLWLKHLRNEFPTVAFKASTQTQNDNLARSKVKMSAVSDDLLKSSHCLGSDILMKLLGNYCRNQDIKSVIRVGVVGFPNTGKSSIINSLKRTKVCNVGATPGVTKSMQEIQLDKHIKLLDSPGVVMARTASETATVLRNVVKIETIPDPIEPVEAILKRCTKQQLMLHYTLTDYNTTNEFLALLATRRGKLKKGGVPDVMKAARCVLQDWTMGKITYYTHPPEKTSLPSYVSAELVAKLGKEFNIESIMDDEDKIIQSLKDKGTNYMLVDSVGPVQDVVDENDLVMDNDADDDKDEEIVDSNGVDDIDDEEMDEESDEDEEGDDDAEELPKLSVSLPVTRSMSARLSMEASTPKPVRAPRGRPPRTKREQRSQGLLEVTQLNKERVKDFKKMKKQRKRDGKVSDTLSESMAAAFSFSTPVDADGDYNFATDYK